LHALEGSRAMGRNNVLERPLALGGLVDEPVMSLAHRTRSVRSAGDGVRIPVETDHPFQSKPITDSIPSRSPIPVDADH